MASFELVDVMIRYEATCRRRGRRVATAVLTEVVPVRIERISDESAPVVARLATNGAVSEFRSVDGVGTCVFCGSVENGVVDVSVLRGHANPVDSNPVQFASGEMVEVRSSGRDAALCEAFRLADNARITSERLLLRSASHPCHVVVLRGVGAVRVESVSSPTGSLCDALTDGGCEPVLYVDPRVSKGDIVTALSTMFPGVESDGGDIETFSSFSVDDEMLDAANVHAVKAFVQGVGAIAPSLPSDVFSEAACVASICGDVVCGRSSSSNALDEIDARLDIVWRHFDANKADRGGSRAGSFWSDFSTIWRTVRSLDLPFRAANDDIGSLSL